MFTASRRGEAEAGRPVRAVQGRAEEGVKRCGGEREEEDLQVREEHEENQDSSSAFCLDDALWLPLCLRIYPTRENFIYFSLPSPPGWGVC